PVEGTNDLVDVDPGYASDRLLDRGILVEEQRCREPGELKRAEDPPLGARREDAGGGDGPTGPRGSDHTLTRLGGKWHPVGAEARGIAECALQRCVPPLDVLLGSLGQADENKSPAQLIAIAPLEYPQRRHGRIGPRAGRVAEQGCPDRF